MFATHNNDRESCVSNPPPRRRLGLGATALLIAAFPAQALAAVNPGFETGDLTGWSQFLTDNGSIGTPTVTTFDTDGNGSASYAAHMHVGKADYYGAGGSQGGGLSQQVVLDAGTLTISVDVAVYSDDYNTDAGWFMILFDGGYVDSHDFYYISAGQTERHTLSGSVTGVTAGTHEIAIRVTREYMQSPDGPEIYLDDLSHNLEASDCVDYDGDGYGVPGTPTCWGGPEEDCDDYDPTVFPGATEQTCDGVDNDCDGALYPDEVDADGDGYAPCEGDCDPADPAVNPGEVEVACDDLDNDCDGAQHGDDIDGDGDGFDECAGDCDDSDATLHPGAFEFPCDGLDND